jgi:hypothetical protein
MFLDSDDYIFPDKLSIQVQSLIVNDADVSICDYKKMNFSDKTENIGQYTSPFPTNDVLASMIIDWEKALSIPCHCIVFRKSLLYSPALRFNTKLPNHEDWTFWVQLFSKKPKIVFIKQVLCYYYYVEKSLSTDMKSMRKGFLASVGFLKAYLKKADIDKKYIDLLNEKKEWINRRYAKYNTNFYLSFKKRALRRIQLIILKK